MGYGVNGDLCVGECADGFHPAAYVDEDGCIIDY